MRPELTYRVLFYLTLALAGACLTCAEQPFIPEMPYILGFYLVLVGLAGYAEGRWSLPVWGANLLGLAIAIGAVLWLIQRFDNAEDWAQDVPLHAFVVPYLGPVTMALLAVRLFRPRTPSDFWMLQGMGLLQVALGCVLATGPFFVLLLVLYLMYGVSLLLDHERLSVRRPGFAGFARGPRSLANPASPRRRGTPAGMGWLIAVASLSFPLYLATPRGSGQDWDPFQWFGGNRDNRSGQLRIGHGDEVDLNRTGVLVPDETPAFLVRATAADGTPLVDLPGDLRWRGSVLQSYEGGRWSGSTHFPGAGASMRLLREGDEPPDRARLDFTIQTKRVRGLFLANPVLLLPSGKIPIRVLDAPSNPRAPALFFENNGTIQPLTFPVLPEYHYRQCIDLSALPERFPARKLQLGKLPAALGTWELLSHKVPTLGPWTYSLLSRLSREPRNAGYGLHFPELPEGGGVLEEPHLQPKQWAAAARLLSDYLADSGDYAYSLRLRRQDRELDPVLDFLWNVKEGHCERFAGALALMLRSVGIPSRMVRGFRGVDHQGEGTYLIRQSYAHAWVEVLVPQESGGPGLDWLTVDPTPMVGQAERPEFSLGRLIARGAPQLWRELFVPGSPGEGAWSRLTVVGKVVGGLFLLLVLLLLSWWLRRWVKPWSAFGGRLTPYRRLVLLARRVGLTPRLGQTPREFAADFARLLAGRAFPEEFAGLPEEVVNLHYRSRFGGEPADPEAERGLLAELDALGRALRGKIGR